eukprot:2100359-Pleurochrysis_carterae.AAC.2
MAGRGGRGKRHAQARESACSTNGTAVPMSEMYETAAHATGGKAHLPRRWAAGVERGLRAGLGAHSCARQSGGW